MDYKKRPLSWSQIASFNYDKEQWYKKYVLGEKEPENILMKFGKEVGEKLATDPTFLPEVKRYEVFEKKLEARIGNIFLVGFIDSFNPKNFGFFEYKTSSNKNKWTQQSTQDHGQLLFYKFLIWLNYKIVPERITSTLYYIPVEETGDFKMRISDEPIQDFTVTHTTSDILDFAVYIKRVVKEMSDYKLSK